MVVAAREGGAGGALRSGWLSMTASLAGTLPLAARGNKLATGAVSGPAGVGGGSSSADVVVVGSLGPVGATAPDLAGIESRPTGARAARKVRTRSTTREAKAPPLITRRTARDLDCARLRGRPFLAARESRRAPSMGGGNEAAICAGDDVVVLGPCIGVGSTGASPFASIPPRRSVYSP